jgi:hypothetical protein
MRMERLIRKTIEKDNSKVINCLDGAWCLHKKQEAMLRQHSRATGTGTHHASLQHTQQGESARHGGTGLGAVFSTPSTITSCE